MTPAFHVAPAVAARGVIGRYSALLGIDQRTADAEGIADFVDQVVSQAVAHWVSGTLQLARREESRRLLGHTEYLTGE